MRPDVPTRLPLVVGGGMVYCRAQTEHQPGAMMTEP